MADGLASSGAASAPVDETARVRVLLPLPLAEAYEYRVPAGLRLAPGDYVLVPLGGRELPGMVWGPGGGAVEERKLRAVIRRFDLPPLGETGRAFIDWVARYTLSPPGAVLRMGLNVPAALEPPRPVAAFRRAGAAAPPSSGSAPGSETAPPEPAPVRLSPARRRVLDLLADGPPRPA